MQERNIDQLPAVYAWTRDQTYNSVTSPDWESHPHLLAKGWCSNQQNHTDPGQYVTYPALISTQSYTVLY